MPAETNGLRVEVLGQLRSWLDSTETSLGPPRRRAVFAVLAMRMGRPITRAELIAAVWGDTRPASVEGNLHTYISGLRRALDPTRAGRSADSLLISDASGYAVRVAPSDLDAAVFEQLCEDAARKATAEDHRAVVASLDTALGLWRGEALSGVPGPFADAERERLARLRLTAVERRAVAVLALGGHRALSAELTGLVHDHPMRESLRELLMLALYRSGRHTEALDVFRDARRVLVAELGVEPGPALRRLHERVLAFDPTLDPPDRTEDPESDALSVRSVPTDPTDPGEPADASASAERLRGLVTDLADRRGRMVWVEGVAGSGTADVLTEGLADAEAIGCQVRRATCRAADSRFPLRVLRTCVGIEAPADETEPDRATVEGLRAFVDELCARGPLVLVVDDVQWADNASLRLLGRLSAATRRLPLLLVIAGRPAPEHDELSRLRHRVDVVGGVALALPAPPTTEADDAVRVAVRLAGVPMAPWVSEWLSTHHDAVAGRAPAVAADLVERAVVEGRPDDPHREELLTALTGLLRRPDLTDDPPEDDPVVEDHVPDPARIWRARQRQFADDPAAELGGYRTAYTFQTLWLVCTAAMAHQRALSYLDQAIAAVRGHRHLAAKWAELLGNRAFTLQNLDSLDEAGRALNTAREIGEQLDLPTTPLMTAITYHYWRGQWDDALAESVAAERDRPAVVRGLREPGVAAALLHSVRAIIAARRDEGGAAANHLELAEQHAATARGEVGFLLAARSVVAERAEDPERAVRALRPMLDPKDTRMTLRHHWLPRLVRLAVAAGDLDLVQEAVDRCTADAAREPRPAGVTAAARWCRGLAEHDPIGVLRAAAHYREVGRRMEMAGALEDAAALAAESGDTDEAVRALREAVEIYTELSARWDVRRAERRLAARGVGGDETSATGRGMDWEPLSPSELRVATRGSARYTDPQIAEHLALPRRNIQTHVASLLNKLDGASRTDGTDDTDTDRRAQDHQ